MAFFLMGKRNKVIKSTRVRRNKSKIRVTKALPKKRKAEPLTGPAIIKHLHFSLY
jgi:hypothetical protein